MQRVAKDFHARMIQATYNRIMTSGLSMYKKTLKNAIFHIVQTYIICYIHILTKLKISQSGIEK